MSFEKANMTINNALASVAVRDVANQSPQLPATVLL